VIFRSKKKETTGILRALYFSEKQKGETKKKSVEGYTCRAGLSTGASRHLLFAV
jgi:hypothetical protein